jgi:hypothetical protein
VALVLGFVPIWFFLIFISAAASSSILLLRSSLGPLGR